MAVAVLGALPEFAWVDAARKHGPILLRLVPENSQLFPFQIIRADRHDPINLMRLPFLPGAAVLPDLEALTLAPDLADTLINGVGANPVGAVRVGQVAGHVNLGGL